MYFHNSIICNVIIVRNIRYLKFLSFRIRRISWLIRRFSSVMAKDSVTYKRPISVFGVLADVQYADCDDRPASCSYSKTRYYRESLNQVDKAFKYWKESNDEVKFVLQLGDIIDGQNITFGGSHVGLYRTLSHFEKHSSIPTFHTVGNHELYNFNRKELAMLFYESVKRLNIPTEIFSPLKPETDISSSTPVLYYKFCPVPNLKLISLDCFDISVLGYDKDHPKYQEGSKVLTSKHGHSIFEDWDCEGPLQKLDIRFQQMNGAIGPEQLMWLEQELKESDELGQKVIAFGHVSLNPDSSDWSCLLWNYNEVIEVFHRHKCVIAYFNGHTHESGYATDSQGISYVSFAGIIETPPDTTAFATVSVYDDHLEIKGHGLEQSYNISLLDKNSVTDEIFSDSEVGPSPSTVKVKV